MPASGVRSRADLEAYLGQSLLSEYFDTSGRRPRRLSTSLKTYLVELHTDSIEPEALSHEPPFEEVRPTKDSGLWRARDSAGESYFLDVSDDRFAFLHTIGHTNRTDATWNRLVSRVPQADNCWIPTRMLESFRLGEVIGFRLFSQLRMDGLGMSDEAKLLASDLGRDQPPAFRLAVSDWATAQRDLTSFRQATSAGARAALQSINWRQRAVSSDGAAKFIHDEVWSNGKVTAYGTSWAGHLANMRALRQAYRALIDGIEADLTLQWADGQLAGAPIEVAFEGLTIADLPKLARDIASGSDPFRMIGQVEVVGEDACIIDAIDMHTSGRLHLEIHSEGLRIYLRRGTCGNVVPRFLVNFENHLTAMLRTSIDDRLDQS